MNYDTYIFDMYGTLVDINTDEEDPAVWERLSLHYRYKGCPIQPEELLSTFESTVERQMANGRMHCEHPDFDMVETFKRIAESRGCTVDSDWLYHTVYWFRLLTMRHLALFPGGEQTIRTLKERGKKLFVLSNGQKVFIESELKALGLYGYFDGIAISSEAGVAKPDPLFFEYLADRFGATFDAALMIGNDHRTDLLGASRAGIDACYFHSNSSPAVARVSSKYQIRDGVFTRILDI